jgi:uncharacterized membrane protein YhaH (DUF805 family)
MHWYVAVLKKYAEFDGRASRTEFWMFWLVHFVIRVGLLILAGFADVFLLLFFLYQLVLLLPTISVTIRRLHDADRSGWWYLVVFFPVVGGVALLGMAMAEGDPGENKYGPPPVEAGAPGSVGDTILQCPHCDAPYNPGDYRADTAHIYCSTCKGEIEGSPGT